MHVTLISCHGVRIASVPQNHELYVPVDSVPGELDFFRNTDDDLIPPLNARSWETSLLGCKQSQCSLSKPLVRPPLALEPAVKNQYDLGHLIPHASSLNMPLTPLVQSITGRRSNSTKL